MKETTNSNGDLHFGHFKAGMAHENISLVHYLMAKIPYRTGYSPKRWKSATDVMIMKKAGLDNVEKLRTIVLYEADFNHNNKSMGRHFMHSAIENNQLAPEQYSTPGKKAIDHALNRRLLFDITNTRRLA